MPPSHPQLLILVHLPQMRISLSKPWTEPQPSSPGTRTPIFFFSFTPRHTAGSRPLPVYSGVRFLYNNCAYVCVRQPHTRTRTHTQFLGWPSNNLFPPWNFKVAVCVYNHIRVTPTPTAVRAPCTEGFEGRKQLGRPRAPTCEGTYLSPG